MLIRRLKHLLQEKDTCGLDIDSPEAVNAHAKIIRKKKCLNDIYRTWYANLSRLLPADRSGPVLEIGSGGGFLKKFVPDLLTSEIRFIPQQDIILDGCRLPFRSNALGAIAMVNAFHHLSDIRNFLSAAMHCIYPGGAIIMIEPWVTPWSRCVYSYLHHEPFDLRIKRWRLPPGGPLSQANAALPWVVFERDRDLFYSRFPNWHLARIDLQMPFSYLLCGGLSMRSLLPAYPLSLVKRLEKKLRPWMGYLAMFATIVLYKRE